MILEYSAYNNLTTLYHGFEKLHYKPSEGYIFFTTDKEYSKNYGDYVFECKFDLSEMDIFHSDDINFIKELYDQGFKLSDDTIDRDWSYMSNKYKLNDKYVRYVGFNSPEDIFGLDYINDNTWELIESNEKVVSHILNKYDAIKILEDGFINYYLDIEKAKMCKVI